MVSLSLQRTATRGSSRRICRRGTPLVLLDRTVRGLAVDSVVSDGIGGVASAINHLVDQGHARIGIVLDATDAPLSSMRMRLPAWTDTLLAAGIDPAESLSSFASLPMEDGYRATRRLVCQPRPPTALFTASNLITIGGLRVLRQLASIIRAIAT
jgi:LacI family transcriptional regulator